MSREADRPVEKGKPAGVVECDQSGEEQAAEQLAQDAHRPARLEFRAGFLPENGTKSMSHPDAFALKNSGLNEFLFAEVGTELNGSQLTVLSTLARLGLDPWTEAARWTKLPKNVMIDYLAHSIAQMPLGRQALVEAHITASRLILLLPSQAGSTQQGERNAITTLTMPGWAPIAFFCCALAFGMAVNAIMTTRSTTPETTPTGQTITQHK